MLIQLKDALSVLLSRGRGVRQIARCSGGTFKKISGLRRAAMLPAAVGNKPDSPRLDVQAGVPELEAKKQ